MHKIIATVSFIALIFWAGLGLEYINPKLPFNELMIGIAGYLFFLYVAFSGLRRSQTETLMYVLLMFAVQFGLSVFMKGVQGYSGWLLFGLIVGRFIGIEHPASEIEQPLDQKRIILGWLTLLIFVLCFSPAPIQMEIIID